jgi:hypothetical protein
MSNRALLLAMLSHALDAPRDADGNPVDPAGMRQDLGYIAGELAGDVTPAGGDEAAFDDEFEKKHARGEHGHFAPKEGGASTSDEEITPAPEPAKKGLFARLKDRFTGKSEPDEPEEQPREVTADPRTLTKKQIKEASFKPPDRHKASAHDSAIGMVDAGGKRYFWKGCGAHAGSVEEAMSDLCAADSVKCPAVRHTAVPKAPSENRRDPTGVLAEFIEASSLADALGGRAASDAEKADGFRKNILPKLEPGEVDRVALLSMMTGGEDRHCGNYLLKDGRLVAIDNEHSLWDQHGAGEHDATKYALCDPLKWVSEGKPESYNFDKAVIEEMADAAPAMADAIREKFPKSARVIEQQGAAFKKWAEGDDYTLDGLRAVGGGKVQL